MLWRPNADRAGKVPDRSEDGMSRGLIRIGCAGWALRKQDAVAFGAPGSHLERYARRLHGVEINSSFYRPHRRSTYERWSASVPDDFRFAVKAPKAVTHAPRLEVNEAALDGFVDEVSGLGGKLGPLLIQFPPSLYLDAAAARIFFAALRRRFPGSIVCEPRNASWFGSDAETLLREFQIARVVADPAPVPEGAEPGSFNGVDYFRLHGSPRVYYSAYEAERLNGIAASLDAAARGVREVWCIFDNTAAGAALGNALQLQELVGATAG
jgi:uncharacterized protein YecE (DUF72 family)